MTNENNTKWIPINEDITIDNNGKELFLGNG